jgi:TonB family protein
MPGRRAARLRFPALSLATLAASLAAAPAHAAPRPQGWEQVGGWQLRSEGPICALQRQPEEEPRLFVHTAPSTAGMVVHLGIMPWKAPAGSAFRLTLDGKPFGGLRAPEDKGGALLMQLDPPSLASLAAARMLDVLGTDGRSVLRFPLHGAGEAIARLQACSAAAAARTLPFAPPAPPPPAPPAGSGSPRRAQVAVSGPSMLSDMDYPAAAIRAGEEGTSGFRVDVGADGRVTGCTITESSGSATLDETTCRIVSARMVFHPARDAQGRAVPDTFSSRIAWRIPASEPPPTAP